MLNAPLLNGRYQPVSLVAEGGSARVFRGTDQLLGREVAIKVLRAGGLAEREALRRELGLVAGLAHHGIVAVLDVGIDDSLPEDPRPFLVMELVRGETVRQRIDAGALGVRDIGGIGFEIAEVLEYVHAQGVVHRDVTPANILLVDYGTAASRPRARLTDFGIATTTHGGASGQVTVGTAAYVSPEQAVGQPLTGASDIYSLGLVLLEAFSGRIEFPGTSVEEIAVRLGRDPVIARPVPRAWRGLLAAMTRREPAERPSAAEVLEALRVLLRDAG